MSVCNRRRLSSQLLDGFRPTASPGRWHWPGTVRVAAAAFHRPAAST